MKWLTYLMVFCCLALSVVFAWRATTGAMAFGLLYGRVPDGAVDHLYNNSIVYIVAALALAMLAGWIINT